MGSYHDRKSWRLLCSGLRRLVLLQDPKADRPENLSLAQLSALEAVQQLNEESIFLGFWTMAQDPVICGAIEELKMQPGRMVLDVLDKVRLFPRSIHV